MCEDKLLHHQPAATAPLKPAETLDARGESRHFRRGREDEDGTCAECGGPKVVKVSSAAKKVLREEKARTGVPYQAIVESWLEGLAADVQAGIRPSPRLARGPRLHSVALTPRAGRCLCRLRLRTRVPAASLVDIAIGVGGRGEPATPYDNEVFPARECPRCATLYPATRPRCPCCADKNGPAAKELTQADAWQTSGAASAGSEGAGD